MPQDIYEDEKREEESEEDLVDVVDVVVEPISAGASDEDEDLVVNVEDEGVEDFVIANAREVLVEVVINNRAVEVLAVDVEDEEEDKRAAALVVIIVGEELTEVVFDEEEVGRVETLPVDVEDEVVEGLVVEVARGDVVEVITNAGREADEVVEPKYFELVLALIQIEYLLLEEDVNEEDVNEEDVDEKDVDEEDEILAEGVG
ncbi:uncharacterized protein Bfra_008712 [Botrytis fragariae]|uniref:Uncharacterized protein n=1 Tax=Botrytis fragariae TaxID=1964551 RepID=A0A8H6APS6_9HELO|nr:uncharacterized protein Bfra_008712 [Botrytis fragariae]KAF5871688.1 hypothetical protein Bfra_008712 [Botrytis fragariae]